MSARARRAVGRNEGFGAPEKHARLRRLPFGEASKMFRHGALEDIALFFVERGDIMRVGYEPVMAPRLEQFEHDGLCERRSLQVGRGRLLISIMTSRHPGPSYVRFGKR